MKEIVIIYLILMKDYINYIFYFFVIKIFVDYSFQHFR